MLAVDPDETSSTELAATYDRGFSLLKDATLKENEHDYEEAKKLYVDGCAVFMQLKEVEKDPKKKETIRKNLNEFITAAERVDKKLSAVRPKMTTTLQGESSFTGENGGRPTSGGDKIIVKGEAQRSPRYAEVGETMQYDGPEIEIIVRKNTRSRYGLLVCIILALASAIIISVVLTQGSNSSTNEESHTMTGWRIEIEAEISGFDEGLLISEVETQINPSLEALKNDLGLDSSEVLILKLVHELSEGTYVAYYNVLSEIEGNADIYKTFIQDNRDIMEASILGAVFGSSTTADQIVTIDDTGLVIVIITGSPTELPTRSPTTVPTSKPTAIPTTSEPTILPTQTPTPFPSHSPTVVGSLYQTITWATSFCCLIESEIDSTVSSIVSVLSLSPDRVDIESYSSVRRRTDSEAASTWNINYQIYTYSTDDANLYNDLIGSLEDNGVLEAIATDISLNTNATISSIETLNLSVEEHDSDNDGDIFIMVLYSAVGCIALGLCCFCSYKCRKCSKN